MPVEGLFGDTIRLLGKTLDLRTKRQELISANLANVDTPNYTPSDLSFEGELKAALASKNAAPRPTPDPRYIPLKGELGYGGLDLVQGEVVQVPAKNIGPDGNSVDMESEMGRMAENQIMYNTSVQLLNIKFDMMKQAIKGTL